MQHAKALDFKQLIRTADAWWRNGCCQTEW